MRSSAHSTTGQRGFTVVELMVSTTIIALMMVILVQITTQTTNTWRYTTSKAEQFREARNGFEIMVRRISQATLNTYWDYNTNTAGDPLGYIRSSELRFASGPMQTGGNKLDSTSSPKRPTHGIFFHAPFGHVSPTASGPDWQKFKGLEGLLNTWGYYIEVNDDRDLRPPFLKEEHSPYRIRSRLMEMMQPSGAMMSTYYYTSGQQGRPTTTYKNYAGLDWFRKPLALQGANDAQQVVSHPLAENIIALVLLPKLADQDAAEMNMTGSRKDTVLAPEYYYHSGQVGEAASYGSDALLAGALNSKHQLPPVVQVTMIAIDETSAQRLNMQTLEDDPLEIQDPTLFTKAEDYKKDTQ
ncbi:MAG: Verru_Chthon cassette protein C [Verrucomicrobiaceae bacterium]|nr:MAG: Verru_Chthon cassette protein C [Verrucomicrobiaceae bacterium]